MNYVLSLNASIARQNELSFVRSKAAALMFYLNLPSCNCDCDP